MILFLKIRSKLSIEDKRKIISCFVAEDSSGELVSMGDQHLVCSAFGRQISGGKWKCGIDTDKDGDPHLRRICPTMSTFDFYKHIGSCVNIRGWCGEPVSRLENVIRHVNRCITCGFCANEMLSKPDLFPLD